MIRRFVLKRIVIFAVTRIITRPFKNTKLTTTFIDSIYSIKNHVMTVNWVSIIISNYTFEVTPVCDNGTRRHKEIMITMRDLNTDSCTLNFVGDFNAISLIVTDIIFLCRFHQHWCPLSLYAIFQESVAYFNQICLHLTLGQTEEWIKTVRSLLNFQCFA